MTTSSDSRLARLWRWLNPPRCKAERYATVQTVHALGFRVGGPHTALIRCAKEDGHGGLHDW